MELDNSTAVSYVNKQGGTRSILLTRLVREILEFCDANSIVLVARHIPGARNVLADQLSRGRLVSTEWTLNVRVFRALVTLWGSPVVDLFAVRSNAQLPLFVSPIPDPSAMAVDALSMSWRAMWGYAFPPYALLPSVLRKVRQDQCQLILVAPLWPESRWFVDLLDLLIDLPRQLPLLPDLTVPRSDSSQRPLPSSSSRVSVIRDSLREKGFSDAVADRAAKPQRSSTRAVYESKWQAFVAWCEERKENPLLASVSIVGDFLVYLASVKKLRLSTIQGYRMAIASTLRVTSGVEVGQSDIITSLMKNIALEDAKSFIPVPDWDLLFVLNRLRQGSI